MKALEDLWKEQFHKEGKAQKKRQCRFGAGRFFLSHSKNIMFKSDLYIELWEWLNRQWSGSQCGRTLLLEAAAFSRPPSGNRAPTVIWKWVNFNWDCLRVWSEISNIEQSIPKRPSHPFDPLELYNMQWGVGSFCFLHTKQVLTHSLYLEEITRFLHKGWKKGTDCPPPAQAPPTIGSASNVSVQPSGDTVVWWWTVMETAGFSWSHLFTANPTHMNLGQKEHKKEKLFLKQKSKKVIFFKNPRK